MQQQNFTQGSILKHILIFSWPMFLGNLLQALYNTVDSIWVGRYVGPQGLAAVSVSFPIIFALVALIIGLSMATTTLIAQYFGAQKRDLMERTVTNSLVLLVLLGIVTTGAGLLYAEAILRLINVPGDILPLAISYLRIFIAGLIAMYIYNGVGAIMRGLGDSRTPLTLLIHATILNIVLDPLMILGLGPFPRMGVAGAALATVIAQVYAAGLSVYYLYARFGLLHFNQKLWRLYWPLVRQLFKIGLPAGVQQVLVSLSSLIVSSLINPFGSTVVAAAGAGMRIDQFAFMPAMSIGLAVAAIVGQNLGAGKEHRVDETVKWSSLLGAGITGLVALYVLLFPHTLLKTFTTDRDVIATGVVYLRYMAWAYIPFALMFTLGGVLRGAGDTIPTMLFTIGSLWLIRLPTAKLLSSMPRFGISGVWIALMLSPMIGFIFNLIYYRSGLWRKQRIEGIST